LYGRDSVRPALKLKYTPPEKLLEVLALGGLLYAAGLLFTKWDQLPLRIPKHFGISGEPDGWGDKSNLLVLLLVGAGLYALLTLLSFFPQWGNYPWEITEENAPRQYRITRSMLCWLKMELVWLFAYIEWCTIQVAMGKAIGLSPYLLLTVVLALSATVGFHLVKAYQNR
jgi:uncharacterized membrane protein